MRVLIVEDEALMAGAIRDGLRLEAIAADIAGDGDTALEMLSLNDYDITVLDRDIPGPSGDEIAQHIVASGVGMPILMLTAADRIDDKTTGFELGADDYLTKPFELRELVLRLRALDRRRGHHRPPVRELAGLRVDPFRREVYRDGRYVALTRKQFAVLEVLVAAEGGVVSAEELLERAWDENADPFTNAVRITVSALRKRLGEPWLIATVAGVGYRIDPEAGAVASRIAVRALDDFATSEGLRAVIPAEPLPGALGETDVPLSDNLALLRALARLCVAHADGSVRTTVDQNLLLRFVPHHELPALFEGLTDAGLAQPGAGTVADVTTCPGAESCNLAVTASRQVGAAIAERIEGDPTLARALELARTATIKVSGCPNSCGQHHVADLGFHGAARRAGDRTAPVYQLHLGGGVDHRGARFGRQVIKVPARRVPEAVARMLKLYEGERAGDESPAAFYERVESSTVSALLQDLAALDAQTPDEVFLDIGESVGFRVAIGEGDCAA